MSMETVRKDQETELALFSTNSDKKGVSPLAAYSLATAQLEELMTLAEQGHRSFTSEGEHEDVSSAGPQAEASKGSSGNGIHFNQQSVFEATNVMQKVQTSENDSLTQELKDELAMLQQQLSQIKIEEEFWQKFSADWAELNKKGLDYKDAYAAFKKVIADLESQFKNDPGKLEMLEFISILGKAAFDNEKDWHSHTGFGGDLWKFFHGELSDPKAFQGFMKAFLPMLTEIASAACGGSALFESALTNGSSAFEARVRKLILTIDIITRIIKVLQSSNPKTAMFEMDAILMDIEQLQINSDVQKSQQQQEQNKITSANLKDNLKKIEKELKKLTEHHSHGLFGWIEDFFKSIYHMLKSLVETVYYGVTGNEAKAKQSAKALETPFKTLEAAFKDILSGNPEKIKEGLEQLVTAVVLTLMFGVVGLALVGSKFGKDVNNMTKLAVDAVQALGEAIVAGLAKAVGDDATCKEMLKDAKKLGEAMLANPALKVLGDIAMVAIIIASAISGQYWLAAIMVVLFVASESGLLEKATNAIANSIEKDMGGKNSALAKVIADIIVIAVVTILSAGAGAAEAFLATGVDAAAAAGEEAASITADTASNAAKQGTEEGVETSTTEGPSRAAQIAKRAASMGAFGMGSVLGSSTLALDILEATGKKDDETLAIILELIQVIVAAITAAVGGATTLAQSATQLGKSAEQAGVQMTQAASRVAVAGTAVQGVSGVGQGGEAIIQARVNEDLQTYRGDAALDQATIKNINAMINQTEQELKHLVDQYQQIIQTAFKVPAELENAELQAMLQG